MEEAVCENEDALYFAKDLFRNLLSFHSKFSDLTTAVSEGRRFYVPAIGKCVMRLSSAIGDILKEKLQDDKIFSKNDETLRKYLRNDIMNIVLASCNNIHHQVLVLSAALLEVVLFLYEREQPGFIYSAHDFWLFMFDRIKSEFYKQGGWNALQLMSKAQEEYDRKMEILKDNNSQGGEDIVKVFPKEKITYEQFTSEKVDTSNETDKESSEKNIDHHEKSPTGKTHEGNEMGKGSNEEDTDHHEQPVTEKAIISNEPGRDINENIDHPEDLETQKEVMSNETEKDSSVGNTDDHERPVTEKGIINNDKGKDSNEGNSDDHEQSEVEKAIISNEAEKESEKENPDDHEQLANEKLVTSNRTRSDSNKGNTDDHDPPATEKSVISDGKDSNEENADDHDPAATEKADIGNETGKNSNKDANHEQPSSEKLDIGNETRKDSNNDTDHHEQPTTEKTIISYETVKNLNENPDEQKQLFPEGNGDGKISTEAQKENPHEQPSSDNDIRDETTETGTQKEELPNLGENSDSDRTMNDLQKQNALDYEKQSTERRDDKDIVADSKEVFEDHKPQLVEKNDISKETVIDSTKEKLDHGQESNEITDTCDKSVLDSTEKRTDHEEISTERRNTVEEATEDFRSDSSGEATDHHKLPAETLSTESMEVSMEEKLKDDESPSVKSTGKEKIVEDSEMKKPEYHELPLNETLKDSSGKEPVSHEPLKSERSCLDKTTQHLEDYSEVPDHHKPPPSEVSCTDVQTAVSSAEIKDHKESSALEISNIDENLKTEKDSPKQKNLESEEGTPQISLHSMNFPEKKSDQLELSIDEMKKDLPSETDQESIPKQDSEAKSLPDVSSQSIEPENLKASTETKRTTGITEEKEGKNREKSVTYKTQKSFQSSLKSQNKSTSKIHDSKTTKALPAVITPTLVSSDKQKKTRLSLPAANEIPKPAITLTSTPKPKNSKASVTAGKSREKCMPSPNISGAHSSSKQSSASEKVKDSLKSPAGASTTTRSGISAKGNASHLHVKSEQSHARKSDTASEKSISNLATKSASQGKNKPSKNVKDPKNEKPRWK